MCRVQIPNGRWWPFILIVYRDGWKVWGWYQANICPLYGRWVLGSRISPSAGTLIYGSRRWSNDVFCSSEPNIQLREVTLWYLESLCTLPKHPGRLPLTDVVFSSYEGGVPNLGSRDRKHSRVSTILLHMIKYRYPLVISIICELASHSMAPQYANMQV